MKGNPPSKLRPRRLVREDALNQFHLPGRRADADSLYASLGRFQHLVAQTIFFDHLSRKWNSPRQFADQPSHEFTSQEGADDPFVPLIGLGMPDFDQILFKVQVLPKSPQPPANAPRAGNNTKLKAPFTRYDVNFAVALPDIAMGVDANGTRRGRIELDRDQSLELGVELT